MQIPVVLDGPHGVFKHIERVLTRKHHAVVVVAEGAGQDLLPRAWPLRLYPPPCVLSLCLSCVLPATGECDSGGNPKLAAIGTFQAELVPRVFRCELGWLCSQARTLYKAFARISNRPKSL
jgi:hypothetical protein